MKHIQQPPLLMQLPKVSIMPTKRRMPTRGSRVPGRDRKTRQQGDSILHRHNRRPFQIAVQ